MEWLEFDMIDSGTTESGMTVLIGSIAWCETWVGLQGEGEVCEDGRTRSRNMASTGVATLGQIWGKDIKACGEVIEEMKGKTCSWKDTSLEMKSCLVIKFNNL